MSLCATIHLKWYVNVKSRACNKGAHVGLVTSVEGSNAETESNLKWYVHCVSHKFFCFSGARSTDFPLHFHVFQAWNTDRLRNMTQSHLKVLKYLTDRIDACFRYIVIVHCCAILFQLWFSHVDLIADLCWSCGILLSNCLGCWQFVLVSYFSEYLLGVCEFVWLVYFWNQGTKRGLFWPICTSVSQSHLF